MLARVSTAVAAVVVVVVLVATLLVGPADPVSADNHPGGGRGSGIGTNDGKQLGAEAWWFRATQGSGSSAPVPCTSSQFDGAGHYEWVTPPAYWSGVWKEIRTGDENAPGVSVELWCVKDGESFGTSTNIDLVDFYYVPPADPAAWLERSLDTLGLGLPEIATSPGGGAASLVGLETWFWIEGGLSRVQTTVTAGPIVVTLWADPVSVTFETGDGASVGGSACAGGGTPYAAGRTSTCTYTYGRSSAAQTGQVYTITATVVWSGGYSLNIGGGEDLGTIERQSSITLMVQEAQALVVE